MPKIDLMLVKAADRPTDVVTQRLQTRGRNDHDSASWKKPGSLAAVAKASERRASLLERQIAGL
jgi:hypothetical protein